MHSTTDSNWTVLDLKQATQTSVKEEPRVLESILVTGGSGFIGTNLCRMLTSAGARVTVLDNLSRASAAGFDAADHEIIEGDVRDADTVARAVERVQAVVHLAAFGSVVESVAQPEENFENNVRSTLNVLHAAARRKAKVVFASSGGAVIGAAQPPVNEDSLPAPTSPYGASKLCGEAYCHAFAGSFDLSVVALRFANVYGPNSAHKRGAVTNFAKALLAGEPIVVFGKGGATRDFIHVDDICAGIWAALKTPIQGAKVLHLATGVETRIIDLAKAMADAAGRPDHPIRFEPKRAGELERNFATFDRARQVLGFVPKIALREGLRRTYEWFKDQKPEVLNLTTTDA
jgi:UDP-glucose 4-epimerase